MSIRPVDFNGMMQHSQEVSTIKHHEDQHPATQQQNLTATFDRKLEHQMKAIKQTEEKKNPKEKFDAREEGRNKYFKRDGGRKKQEPEKETAAEKRPMSGFDIKI